MEQDGLYTQSYGVTNYIIFASTGGEMDPFAMGISSGWGGLRTTPEFYHKFSANDARNLFYTATQQEDIDDIGEFSHGIAFMKFRNVNSVDGEVPNKAYNEDDAKWTGPSFVNTDFPMMRYADVLLMAAECQARGAAVRTSWTSAPANFIRNAGAAATSSASASSLPVTTGSGRAKSRTAVTWIPTASSSRFRTATGWPTPTSPRTPAINR